MFELCNCNCEKKHYTFKSLAVFYKSVRSLVIRICHQGDLKHSQTFEPAVLLLVWMLLVYLYEMKRLTSSILKCVIIKQLVGSNRMLRFPQELLPLFPHLFPMLNSVHYSKSFWSTSESIILAEQLLCWSMPPRWPSLHLKATAEIQTQTHNPFTQLIMWK